MGARTAIAWCDCTHNEWWGCARVSRACRFCYAADVAHRWGLGDLWGNRTERRRMVERTRNNPFRWNRAAQAAGTPLRVFASSMSDVFEAHHQIDAWRPELLDKAALTPWLIWQFLTKRPENIAAMVPPTWADGWPSNVWMGASVEAQTLGQTPIAANRIMPLLRLTGPAVRFLSIEPLVSPVNLRHIEVDGLIVDALTGAVTYPDGAPYAQMPARIDWVIVGGESNVRAARMDPAWVRSLAEQAAATNTPFFFKQAGTKLAKEWGCTGKGHDPAEWPEPFPQDFPPMRIPALV